MAPKLVQNTTGTMVKSPESYDARFWFRGQEEYNGACKPDRLHPEVFCLRELEIVVRSDSLQADQQPAKHRARERFGKEWSEHFDDVCRLYPELKKLKLFYDLVAVADVVRTMHGIGAAISAVPAYEL